MEINGYTRPFNYDASISAPTYDAPSEREIWHKQFGDYLKPTNNLITVNTTNIVVGTAAGKLAGADILIKNNMTLTPTLSGVSDIYIYARISESDNVGEILTKVTSGTPTWAGNYGADYEVPIAKINDAQVGNFKAGTLEILINTNFGGTAQTNGVAYYAAQPATKKLRCTITANEAYIKMFSGTQGTGTCNNIDVISTDDVDYTGLRWEGDATVTSFANSAADGKVQTNLLPNGQITCSNIAEIKVTKNGVLHMSGELLTKRIHASITATPVYMRMEQAIGTYGNVNQFDLTHAGSTADVRIEFAGMTVEEVDLSAREIAREVFEGGITIEEIGKTKNTKEVEEIKKEIKKLEMKKEMERK